MAEYDSVNFDPPAPVAYVTLRNPATGALLSEIPMLIDTGADATLLPHESVEQLGLELEENPMFELQGFDGKITVTNTVKLELFFLERKFTGEFLLLDQPMGILGRNILKNMSIVFDGPRGVWEEYKG